MADQKLSTRDLTDTQTTTDDSEGSPNPTPASGMAGNDQPLARDPAGDDRTADASYQDASRQNQPQKRTGRGPASTPRSSGRPSVASDREPLLPVDQGQRFTDRWQEIQASFVDRPRESVAEADTLVADLMQRLAASFSNERDQLESQWDRGDDVSTEDLRVALTRYRSFFDRLLAA